MTTIYFLFWVDATTGNPAFSGAGADAGVGVSASARDLHPKLTYKKSQKGKPVRRS